MSLLIPGTNSIKDTGYNVANSARFNSGSSDYIQRTYGTPTNAKIFGLSWWIKISGDPVAGTGQFDLWGERTNSSNRVFMSLNGSGIFNFFEKNGGSNVLELDTNRQFRDNGAWYHFLLLGDSTQSTASNRIKLYVNGVQETNFSTETYPSQDYEFRLAVNSTKYFGRIGLGGSGLSTNYFDGYLAEVAFVDGTVTAHTDYGEFDEDSPTIWKPKDISGLTFGNNGFHLDFEDSSALGNDVSGNNNDFTVNNLTSVDQSTDTCTNNFTTLNPSANLTGSPTYSEGNLKVAGDSSANHNWQTTFVVSSGKWYWELKDLTSSPDGSLLFYDQSIISGSHPGYGFVFNSRKKVINGSPTGSAIGSSAQNDIWSMALDLDNGKMFIARNGTYLSSGDPGNGTNPFIQTSDGLPSEGVFGGHIYNGSMELNFGSPSFSISSGNADANGFGNFEYAVPSGYFALCTKNLAEFG